MNGFRKPKLDFPAARRTSFSAANTPEAVGEAQLVPATPGIGIKFDTTVNPVACALISGKPRPELLKSFWSGIPFAEERYSLTASACQCWVGHRLQKPPLANPTAVSGTPVVPPTPVTYGDPAGHFGSNLPLLHPAPSSPDAKRREMPLVPALMNSLLVLVAVSSVVVCSPSPYDVEKISGTLSSDVLCITCNHFKNGSLAGLSGEAPRKPQNSLGIPAPRALMYSMSSSASTPAKPLFTPSPTVLTMGDSASIPDMYNFQNSARSAWWKNCFKNPVTAWRFPFALPPTKSLTLYRDLNF
mmetsp:Transcript_27365/g.48385  ORF Transcript_27365/g.48385 Transcript_27365/m.48385 type:complete len:300 (-) Transcript_27365:42-941(-)